MPKKIVHMRLSQTTLDRVESLKKRLQLENRTQIVAQGINLYHRIVSDLKKGSKVRIIHSDGSFERILLLH